MLRYFLLTAVVLSACSAPANDQLDEDTIVQVDNVLKKYRQAWLENDTAVIMGCLSDDILLFIPGNTSPKVEGKKAVREFWFTSSDLSYPIKTYDISGQEIFGGGSYATATGRSVLSWQTIKGDSLISTDTVKSDYLTILRKEGDAWRIYRQMYQPRE